LKHYRPFRFIRAFKASPEIKKRQHLRIVLRSAIRLNAGALVALAILGAGAYPSFAQAPISPALSELSPPMRDLLQKGNEAYKRQDFLEAIRLFGIAADQGTALAQAMLGVIYIKGGNGVIADHARAAGYYLKAAEQGFAPAQYAIGLAYDEGDGVARDHLQAVFWYRKAAEQGDARAQEKIGVMYSDAKDYANALVWLRKSSDQNNAEAEADLGWLYENGYGVPRDYKTALDWYRQAADQGHAVAQTKVGGAYYYGRGVAIDYAQASIWFQKAAEQGEPVAESFLGTMYMLGQGVQTDYGLAMTWFQRAAEKNNADAEYGIGLLYEYGKGVKANITQAEIWYRRAAEHGSVAAKQKLLALRQHEAERAADEIPVALRIRCLWKDDVKVLRPRTAPDVNEFIRVHEACLRAGWKELFGDRPYPGD
jgi:TPR repeat protein